MKIVNLNLRNEDVAPRFATRKPNEREYADNAGFLERCSRPISREKRLENKNEKNWTLSRHIICSLLIAVSFYGLLCVFGLLFSIILPFKIVILTILALGWFWFWFSGLE